MNVFTVTVREVARNQKQVFDKVRKTKRPAIVVNKSEGPQVAIVPLEDLKDLEKINDQKSIQVLLDLVKLGEKYSKQGKTTNALKEVDQMWRQWGKDE